MPKEVKHISDEKLDEVTENLLDERREAGGDAACIKGVASITDIFVELRESRSLINEQRDLLREVLDDVYQQVMYGGEAASSLNFDEINRWEERYQAFMLRAT
jgi:hypothetical protein